MKKNKVPKERNPFVLHLVGKKQGPHEKSKKIIRRDAKAQLKKECFHKVALEQLHRSIFC